MLQGSPTTKKLEGEPNKETGTRYFVVWVPFMNRTLASCVFALLLMVLTPRVTAQQPQKADTPESSADSLAPQQLIAWSWMQSPVPMPQPAPPPDKAVPQPGQSQRQPGEPQARDKARNKTPKFEMSGDAADAPPQH